MSSQNVEIITVNYNTPDILNNLLNSIQKNNSSNYHIRIIDGSDKTDFIKQDLEIATNYNNCEIIQLHYNIHHGPGMHYAIMNSKYEYLLICDSDIIINSDLTNIVNNMMSYNKSFVGFSEEVNTAGINVNHKDITYIHPRFMLVNKSEYIKLANIGVKFKRHGAPCIDVMKYIHDKHIENDMFGIIGNSFCNIAETYFSTKESETCKRFGCNFATPKELFIVSLTTWHGRINNIPAVLGSILKGTELPDKIVLNLCKDDFPELEKSIPENVIKFLQDNSNIIEVNWLNNNSYVWKKSIPTLYKYPNSCVLCIDDDYEYPADFVATFKAKHKEYPSVPIFGVKASFHKDYMQHCGTSSLDKLEWLLPAFESMSKDIYELGDEDGYLTWCYGVQGIKPIYVGKNYHVNMKNIKNTYSYSKDILNKKRNNYKNIFVNHNFNQITDKKLIEYICAPIGDTSVIIENTPVIKQTQVTQNNTTQITSVVSSPDSSVTVHQTEPTKVTSIKKGTAVYTCITDNTPLNENLQFSKYMDYICFTTNKNLVSEHWDVRYVEHTDIPEDKISLYYKTHPYDELNGYMFTIWIDPHATPITDFEECLSSSFNGTNAITFFKHSKCKCIYKYLKEKIAAKRINRVLADSLLGKLCLEGMPENYGFFNTQLICCRLDVFESRLILNDLWTHIKSGIASDVYLPYVLWRYKNKKTLFRTSDEFSKYIS